jgi:hypothetical protein
MESTMPRKRVFKPKWSNRYARVLTARAAALTSKSGVFLPSKTKERIADSSSKFQGVQHTAAKSRERGLTCQPRAVSLSFDETIELERRRRERQHLFVDEPAEVFQVEKLMSLLDNSICFCEMAFSPGFEHIIFQKAAHEIIRNKNNLKYADIKIGATMRRTK